MWDLIAVFSLFLAMAGVLELVRSNMQRIIEANPRMAQARTDYETSTEDAKAHILHLRQLQAKRQGAADAIELARSRIDNLTKNIADVRPDLPILIKEFGKPMKNCVPFSASVTNRLLKYSTKPAVVERLNPVYGRQVEIVVWAQNRVDAKRIIEREYPADMGFTVIYSKAFMVTDA
jgi:hypothetical protein